MTRSRRGSARSPGTILFCRNGRRERLFHAYGTRAADVLGKARNREDLGQDFGAGLTYARSTTWSRRNGRKMLTTYSGGDPSSGLGSCRRNVRAQYLTWPNLPACRAVRFVTSPLAQSIARGRNS